MKIKTSKEDKNQKQIKQMIVLIMNKIKKFNFSILVGIKRNLQIKVSNENSNMYILIKLISVFNKFCVNK